MEWRGVAWRGLAWRRVEWRGVAWRRGRGAQRVPLTRQSAQYLPHTFLIRLGIVCIIDIPVKVGRGKKVQLPLLVVGGGGGLGTGQPSS